MNGEEDFDNNDTSTGLSEDRVYAHTSESENDDELGFRGSVRQQIESDVEAFLAAGGSITEVPPNVVADPPKKPQSNYGGQPI